MILPPILVSKTAYVTTAVLGAFAVTEAFFGQLIIALIAAMPPTGMVILAWISNKRGQAIQQQNQAIQLKNQEEIAKALDGKLDKLMQAEKAASKAEGGAEERDRVDVPQKVEVVQPLDSPVPVMPVKPVKP